MEMDSDGDVHYTLSGVVVEHHRRWNDASSARARRVIDALSPETPEAQLIMRNVHILKHAMVGGIGLRQLCDLAMAYRHYDGQYDPASLTGKLREAGLGKWNGLLNAFLVQVIGCEYIAKDLKLSKEVFVFQSSKGNKLSYKTYDSNRNRVVLKVLYDESIIGDD